MFSIFTRTKITQHFIIDFVGTSGDRLQKPASPYYRIKLRQFCTVLFHHFFNLCKTEILLVHYSVVLLDNIYIITLSIAPYFFLSVEKSNFRTSRTWIYG